MLGRMSLDPQMFFAEYCNLTIIAELPRMVIVVKCSIAIVIKDGEDLVVAPMSSDGWTPN